MDPATMVINEIRWIVHQPYDDLTVIFRSGGEFIDMAG